MMTTEKLTEVLDRYEEFLEGLDVGDAKLDHLRGMIPRARVLLAEDRREKLMRWIGFIQGALWSDGYFELDELKRHNMPDKGEDE